MNTGFCRSVVSVVTQPVGSYLAITAMKLIETTDNNNIDFRRMWILYQEYNMKVFGSMEEH